MNKLAKVISELSQDELRQLKRELELGNLHRMVNLRMQEEADPNKVCPVCHAGIDDESMTLTFGPIGLRKKASFCASDCLEYFLERMREQKNPKLQKTVGGIK